VTTRPTKTCGGGRTAWGAFSGSLAGVEERLGEGLGATKGDMAGDGSPTAATKGEDSTPTILTFRNVCVF